MPGLEMVGVRCANGCRDRDRRPFVIGQVDARAEAADLYCGKCRRMTFWRRRVAQAV